MENEHGRSLEVLALLADLRPMQALLANLREHDIRVDVATDLAEARGAFFGSGGHDCLVLAPDVGPGLAAKVLDSLRAVDPELPAATFGPGCRDGDRRSRTAVLAGFHPSSRAGAGALLRFLAGIRR
ncbi:MAG: hypothetical protein KDE27_12335 [Planctomycetes bacterium]|nr:hypothetical protein [Planctomycetota bacterium]